MNQELKASLHNRFDIEVKNAKTGEVKQKAYAENIILNQAWAQILADDVDWFDHIKIGTGTGTIAATRTTLFTQIVTRAATDMIFNSSISENWYSLRQKIVILENEFVGSTLTELGIGTDSVLCTHALLKDMNGNQVSIVKSDTDIITVYATVYLKVPAWSKTGAIDFIRYEAGKSPLICILLGRYATADGGNGTSVFRRFPSWIAASAGSCAFEAAQSYAQANITKTLDIANKKLTFYHRIPAGSANVSGLRSYFLGCTSPYPQAGAIELIGIASVATKIQELVIEQIGTGNGADSLFSTSFPFVKSGAVIKVDGVVSAPTVICDAPKKKNISGYMQILGKTGNGERERITGTYAQYTGYPAGAESGDLILENPFYTSYGIDSISATNITLFTSDDMITWTQVYTGSGTYTVAAGHKQKRYWKAIKAATTAWAISAINVDAFDALKNVIFATAPATGAVITAEYDTDCMAKDINHAADITVVIQLGEYTP